MIIVSASKFHNYLEHSVLCFQYESVSRGAFNQEKALEGALSMIVKTSIPIHLVLNIGDHQHDQYSKHQNLGCIHT